MNDQPDDKIGARLKDLLGGAMPLVEARAADQWVLRSSGFWHRRLVMSHAPSDIEITAEAGGVDRLVLRSVFKLYITNKGGTVVEPGARVWRGLARGLQIVGPLLFAAWLGWILSGTGFSPRLALEVGAGATVLLAVHELGHVVTLRRFGIAASLPTFIPVLGAIISSDGIESRDAKTEAIVGMAGPIIGTAAAYVALGLFALTGWPPFVLMALVALGLNAFNLLPLPPLDGGRAAAAITPWLWPIGLAGLAVYVWWKPGFLVGLVLAVGTLSVIVRFRKRNRSDYYRVSWRVRLAVLGTYLGTVGAIVGGLALVATFGQEALKLVH